MTIAKVKNILLSLVVVAGVLALVAGITQAAWSSTATSTNNTFESGTVGVELSGDVISGNTEGVSVGRFFNAEGLFPGEYESSIIEITNTSDVAIQFAVTGANFNYGSSTAPHLDTALLLKVEHIMQGYTVEHSEGTLWSPHSQNAVWFDFSDGNTLRDLRNGNVSPALVNENQPLPAGQTAVYEITVKLDEDANNNLQGKSVSADLVVTATKHATQPE